MAAERCPPTTVLGSAERRNSRREAGTGADSPEMQLVISQTLHPTPSLRISEPHAVNLGRATQLSPPAPSDQLPLPFAKLLPAFLLHSGPSGVHRRNLEKPVTATLESTGLLGK